MINAIPTTYRGVRFRSRLEARYAALFDLLRWQWDYEPIDLRGYVPDFIVDTHDPYQDRPLLVECKPYLVGSSEREIIAATARIERSGWKGEAVVVGIGQAAYLGQHGTDGRLVWGPATYVRHATPAHWTLQSIATPRACRTCYARDFTPDPLTPFDDFRSMWVEAGNTTQWKAPA